MRKSIFYFLLCLPPISATCQPATDKKVLTVEGIAEQTVRADEIYYSITSLAEMHRILQNFDLLNPFGLTDSLGYLPVSVSSSAVAPVFSTDACTSADSVLRSWLSLYGSEIEVIEQESYDEIGISAAPSDRFILKIKSAETFKSLMARLETCPCFIGELVQVGYSRPEALRQALTLTALREAKRNAEEMLTLLGSKVRAVYNIAPAKVSWGDTSLASADDWYPFNPQLNHSLELKCRVEVTVQFLFK